MHKLSVNAKVWTQCQPVIQRAPITANVCGSKIYKRLPSIRKTSKLRIALGSYHYSLLLSDSSLLSGFSLKNCHSFGFGYSHSVIAVSFKRSIPMQFISKRISSCFSQFSDLLCICSFCNLNKDVLKLSHKKYFGVWMRHPLGAPPRPGGEVSRNSH